MSLRKGKKARDSLFSKVSESIKPVRKQGAPPEEDLEDMDGFYKEVRAQSVSILWKMGMP